MSEPVVLHDTSPDGVATITLNRPQQMNALSREVLDALANTLQACGDDERVRVIILTGGFELALACDVLMASTQARFADTHARVGLASGWGLSQKLSRAVGIYRAREISLGARWVSAEQAAAWGFVNRVVAPDELMPAARELAADMLLAQPGMLERYKSIIDDGFALPFGEGMALERQRAREFNASVTATDIEQRREAVRARNRNN